MKNETPKIVKCKIGPYPRPMPEGMNDPMPELRVQLSNGEELTLFSFYPDEISFTESELVGLTIDQAKRRKFEKDLRFLQT